MANLDVKTFQGFGIIFLTALVAGIGVSLLNAFVLNPVKEQITKVTTMRAA